jgi:hypothetical protein
MRFIFLCLALFSYISTLSFSSDVLGQVLFSRGGVTVQGAGNDVTGLDSGVYPGSIIETGEEAFAVGSLETGALFKMTASSVARFQPVISDGILTIQLFRGSMLLNLPSRIKGDERLLWEYEVLSPWGTVSARYGDYYIEYVESTQELEIVCLDEDGVFSLNGLEYSLTSGEKIHVAHGKVFPKAVLGGSEIREHFSLYRDGIAWPVPTLFRELSSYEALDARSFITQIKINGLSLKERQGDVLITPADLVLGRIRIEGKVESKLPHHILQMSYDGGKKYYDLGVDNHFVHRILPEEGDYELKFRLRDLQRYYSVKAPEVHFAYSTLGVRDLALQWRSDLEQAFRRQDVRLLTSMLEGISSLGNRVSEEIFQELSNVNWQNLHLVLTRFTEERSKAMAEFKWTSTRTWADSVEPVKSQGYWRIYFRVERTADKLTAIQMGGDSPILSNLKRNQADRHGPVVFGPSIVRVTPGTQISVDLRIEDRMSPISAVECRLDSTFRGRMNSVIPLDGSYDERREYVRVQLPLSYTGDRFFIRAKDGNRNWGRWRSVTLMR